MTDTDIASAERVAPRRRRSETRQRTASVSARLLPAERQAIERAARASGCGPNTWAREILTRAAGQPTPARHAARTDLARAVGWWTGAVGQIGNNLNQLARYANEGGRVDPDALNRLTIAVRDLHTVVVSQETRGGSGAS
ncbi:Bacterial mobilisation protein (MobC) [Pannonibacter phragmitetus]|uniref:Bacterial mobilisation protein (MobC) n=1 Tax=Pannonibacter phragmitetus TaxID=121719 RepID=A0A378ZWD1_9HYPH|nr:plasmid mobilization relaxosome protein MobC [Pannonibacter phragmitetus]SUB00841.1 Bacterial mobilisation protein (MobC) [Pannonibacter phragmitetus]